MPGTGCPRRGAQTPAAHTGEHGHGGERADSADTGLPEGQMLLKRVSSWEMGDPTSSSLFHGFSGSSQYLNYSHAEISMDRQNIVRGQNRRRSRKHQRFQARKAFLQQRGLLKSKKEESQQVLKDKDAWPHANGTNQIGCLKRCEPIADNHVDSNSSKLDEIKTLLGTLPVISACSPDNQWHLLSHDYGSGLSMPGSSASSRPPSPVAWLKPGNCVAIDCEMVGTGPGGRISELARCSVVNYRGDVVYDKFIKPELPIADYRTQWSGITKKHMNNAISFKAAQKEIVNILKDKRVLGHALHNDFKALKYFHPSGQTRDTSKIYLLNQKAGLPVKPSASLKTLAWHLLHKKIQVGRKGHSSVEDAQTSMELYKLVEDQCEQDLMRSSEVSPSSSPEVLSVSDNDRYMEDQYWLPYLNEDCK
ncbi:apoptosis-enhancing nuclease isoform X2 [Ascaphus truei]|uniref:apoptosis-enhancing nuclease isoform X2 n=1 Tax=Ascaphus truei TaxID=8439 RepID=UPI003F595EB5